MTILTKKKILQRLYSKNEDRLVITPLISDNQIDLGTVDVRLGPMFIIFTKRRIHSVDPTEASQEKIMEYQEKVIYPFGKEFILQPNQFVLGGTLEYLKLPSDVLGYIVGRSSWGRLGLIIETSPIIQPCFTGVLTFELTNLGEAPIVLYPGCRIAQIAFHTSEEKKLEKCEKLIMKSRYSLNIYPEFSKIYEDPDMKRFKKS